MTIGKASYTSRRIECFNGLTRIFQEGLSNQAQSIEKCTRLAFIITFVSFVGVAFA
jgi:hypothetical protein